MPTEKIKIVIPGDDPPQLQNSPHLDRLRQYGEVSLYLDRPESVEEKVRRAQGAVCMLNSRGFVRWPGDVLRQLPNLRMISTCSIGTDAIDLEAARQLGIVVCNVAGRTAFIVAEHAVALMLATARQLAFHTNALKHGNWLRRDVVYLRGKTLGLLGAGSIAAAMAQLGRALGMEVQMWTFHPSPERAASLGVRLVALEELLATSDVVSVHLPLTERTRHLLGPQEFARMKPGAVFINTARGAIVDDEALVAALHSGQLGGAGIDVYAIEPLPAEHPLLTCEQVVLSPHNADQCPEGSDLLSAGAVDNIIAYLAGRPQNRVV